MVCCITNVHTSKTSWVSDFALDHTKDQFLTQLFNRCAVFNNYIYAVGGRDDCMELSSAERYNPHSNSWSPIVAMTSRRSGVSLNNVILY